MREGNSSEGTSSAVIEPVAVGKKTAKEKIDLSGLSHDKVGYGQGVLVDDKNRTTGALDFNARYGEFNAKAINNDDKIYLTFDQGYENGYTEKTLDALKEKKALQSESKILSASASTLVFVMGMKNLPDIARHLLDAGMDPDTPAALVYRGTTPYQRSLVATISTLPQAAVDNKFSNPSVIVVGKVCSLHDQLGWFEQRPLYGRSIVVTRAREQASGLAQSLTELGANVIQCPTIEISPLADYSELDAAVARLAEYGWIIFTSVNGVRHFWKRLAACGRDSRAIGQCKVAAIGPATADALRERGIEPDFIPARYVAEGVVEGLLAMDPVAGVKMLLPRAAKAREVLPDELRKAGAQVDVIAAYETVPAAARKDEVLAAMQNGTLDCVTFGSSSTVENFLSLIPADELRAHPEVKLAAIGPVTAKSLADNGLPCHIQPEAYTIPALVEALKAHYSPQR